MAGQYSADIGNSDQGACQAGNGGAAEKDLRGLPAFHPLVATSTQLDEQEQRIEKAQDIALVGFRENAYFVLVNGSQITDLKTTIELSPKSEVHFIRLVPLQGG